jgi:hypothetical protein
MNFKKSPAAWAGIIQAVMALVVVYVPSLPQGAILALIAAATGLSFQSQKIENQKTEAALFTDPEDIEDLN